MPKYDTKFAVGDIVSTVTKLSPDVLTKQPRAGFKGRKVTRITIIDEGDGLDESIHYKVEGDDRAEWPEHELIHAGDCSCGTELNEDDYQRNARTYNGDLVCSDCNTAQQTGMGAQL